MDLNHRWLVLNAYMYFFPYTFRTQIAALHFNENADRKQDTTREGDDMFSVHYPKYRYGGYIVRKVLEKPTFGEYL